MGFLKNWKGSRSIMGLSMIQLICWLGWLSNFAYFAFAQFDDINKDVTGSVNLVLIITCLGNLAVFVTSLIRRKHDWEIGIEDFPKILSSDKLKIELEHENGLTTCIRTHGMETFLDRFDADVVMLSNCIPNWSMRQFMKSNAPFVRSILLQFLSLRHAVRHAAAIVEVCEGSSHSCNCIVFRTKEEITRMLARRMPQTLKQLSNSMCLLPCRECLRNGCHGCNQEGGYILREIPVEQFDEEYILREIPVEQSDEEYVSREGDSHVVSEILDKISAGSIRAEDPICICIPMNDARRDKWTELLVRSLLSKDAEGRGVRVMDSKAMEGYLAGKLVEYNISSFIVPRVTEVLINLVLTFWFRVDGFSSAILARHMTRDYLVDTKGSWVAANVFITKAKVKRGDDNTQVCQVLSFRGKLLCIIGFISTGCVNIISSLGWAVLISLEGGADSSLPPSMPIVLVIIAAIATAWGVDFAFAIIHRWDRVCLSIIGTIVFVFMFPEVLLLVLLIMHPPDTDVMLGPIVSTLQTVYIVAGSAVAGTLGIKGFGRWVYAALQILAWGKWAVGRCLIHEDIDRWGTITYSSAFLLNAVLAGVRCRWEPWPWKEDHLD